MSGAAEGDGTVTPATVTPATVRPEIAAPSGPSRARHRRPMSAPAALALTVTALLSVFGAGAALLPESFTGSGAEAETPAAALAALAPGAGGAAPAPSEDASLSSASGPPSAAAPPAASPSARASSRPAKSPGTSPSTKATTRATTKTSAPKPKKTTPKAGTPSAGPGQVAQENEVIRLVNVERDRAGCGSLRLDARLRTAIRLHVQELGTHGNLYISHVSDDGRTFAQRVQAQGYRDPGGENVARGQRTAADVMNSWMNSEGHRANILNCSFKAIGVGRAKGVDGTYVWGQVFGRS